MNKDNFQLCYVDLPWCWFAKDLDSIYGDDWDDAPYASNASSPYADNAEDIFYVAIDADMDVPSNFSANEINSKAIPWLCDQERSVEIFAGTTFKEFCKIIRDRGDEVFIGMG